MPDVSLRARDGHQLDAHRIDPLGQPRGAVVVIQEIFGVNAHIRATAARFSPNPAASRPARFAAALRAVRT